MAPRSAPDAPRGTRPTLRRPTPAPAPSYQPAEPLAVEPLPEPLRLFDHRRGQRYELIAAGARGGILVLARDGGPAPGTGQRMTLVGPRHAMVQFVVQAEGPAYDFWHPDGECLRVRWVVVTATERRSHLLEALRSVLRLGEPAPAWVERDELAPARRVVYEAERRSIREIGLVAPPPTAGRTPTGRWST